MMNDKGATYIRVFHLVSVMFVMTGILSDCIAN